MNKVVLWTTWSCNHEWNESLSDILHCNAWGCILQAQLCTMGLACCILPQRGLTGCTAWDKHFKLLCTGWRFSRSSLVQADDDTERLFIEHDKACKEVTGRQSHQTMGLGRIRRSSRGSPVPLFPWWLVVGAAASWPCTAVGGGARWGGGAGSRCGALGSWLAAWAPLPIFTSDPSAGAELASLVWF